jgi:hypothetical protein
MIVFCCHCCSGTRVFSIIHRPTMNLTAETIFQFEDYVPWSIDVCINVPEGTETMAHDVNFNFNFLFCFCFKKLVNFKDRSFQQIIKKQTKINQI